MKSIHNGHLKFILCKLIKLFLDFLTVFLAGFCSIILTGNSIEEVFNSFIVYVGCEAIIVCILFYLLHLYRSVSRYAGMRELASIALASVIIFVINMAYIFIFKTIKQYDTFFGYRYAVVNSLIIFFFLCITRFAKRFCLKTIDFIKKRNNYSCDTDAKDVMIIGAGDAGCMLAREITESTQINYRLRCFIDDDPLKIHKYIFNVPVVGDRSTILKNVDKYNIDEIIIALPAVDPKERRDIINICNETHCKVKTIPGIYDIVNGNVSMSSVRDVDIKDLLGRDQVEVNIDEIIGYITNKTVLVTGGGGSIGSELCRQIARHNPKSLIIVDIYENNAYDIEQELKRDVPSLDFHVLIASIRDRNRIEDIFDTFRPNIVFNAAAHKHVPLMENSPHEAIKNNVFGTLNVAYCCDKYGTSRMIQISTDKAVNPTNIMGASKRLCEMIIQDYAKKSKCEYVAVRFGNVLGSNGSVIPLFKKQMANGGPITVTHPDIIRYFMTIPEAVSLVLQSGAYAKGGEIFVLDMGEPVKIYDLAVNLIKLSGYTLGVNMNIEFSGLRPGEKLYEERLMSEEGLKKTANGLISIAKPIEIDYDKFEENLNNLYKAAYDEHSDIKQLVSSVVTTYKYQK